MNPDLDFMNKRKIHIRVVRQSARRATTTIEGLDDDLDLHRICKYMKKSFNTNGCVLEEKVIQLQGDFSKECAKWLVDQEVITPAEGKERVTLHGV